MDPQSTSTSEDRPDGELQSPKADRPGSRDYMVFLYNGRYYDYMVEVFDLDPALCDRRMSMGL